MDGIEAGKQVLARSAYGDWLAKRATSGVVKGHDFPVVWVCSEQEWATARGDIEAIPWPAEDVKPAD